MAQGAANGLTAEAEAALREVLRELADRLRRYDRRGMYGEVTGAISIIDGQFSIDTGDRRKQKIKLSA